MKGNERLCCQYFKILNDSIILTYSTNVVAIMLLMLAKQAVICALVYTSILVYHRLLVIKLKLYLQFMKIFNRLDIVLITLAFPPYVILLTSMIY